ncbi:MAG: hypothetical protein ACKV19_29540 [Verrucomicrobiales bacterium]
MAHAVAGFLSFAGHKKEAGDFSPTSRLGLAWFSAHSAEPVAFRSLELGDYSVHVPQNYLFSRDRGKHRIGLTVDVAVFVASTLFGVGGSFDYLTHGANGVSESF